jgi:hypothetical protein
MIVAAPPASGFHGPKDLVGNAPCSTRPDVGRLGDRYAQTGPAQGCRYGLDFWRLVLGPSVPRVGHGWSSLGMPFETAWNRPGSYAVARRLGHVWPPA